METLENSLCSQEEPQLGSNVTLIADYRSTQTNRLKVESSLKKEMLDDDLNPRMISMPSGSPSSVDEMLESSTGDDLECLKVYGNSPKKCETEEERISECSSDSTGNSVSESGDPLVRIGVETEIGEGPDVEITSWELERFSRSSDEKCGDERSTNSNERWEQRVVLRSRFKSPEDLIHRLFVCIAGVADQLQTNYPADLRGVLKMVLQPNDTIDVFEVNGRLARGSGREEEVGIEVHESLPNPAFSGVRWVPDSECGACVGCQAMFTLVRRRHHCRNCGQIFCGRCSVNTMPLPELGYNKAVRVCNGCFLYKLNPFTSNSNALATSATPGGNSSNHLNLHSTPTEGDR